MDDEILRLRFTFLKSLACIFQILYAYVCIYENIENKIPQLQTHKQTKADKSTQCNCVCVFTYIHVELKTWFEFEPFFIDSCINKSNQAGCFLFYCSATLSCTAKKVHCLGVKTNKTRKKTRGSSSTFQKNTKSNKDFGKTNIEKKKKVNIMELPPFYF